MHKQNTLTSLRKNRVSNLTFRDEHNILIENNMSMLCYVYLQCFIRISREREKKTLSQGLEHCPRILMHLMLCLHRNINKIIRRNCATAKLDFQIKIHLILFGIAIYGISLFF